MSAPPPDTATDRDDLPDPPQAPENPHTQHEPPRTKDVVEAMRLRPALPSVTRLSRKVLLGLGIAASLGIGGALVYGLQGRQHDPLPKELVATDNRATPDGLARLPKDYSAIPRLGPPLPGDLGRPILDAQRSGKDVPVPSIAPPSAAPPPVSPEEQRRLQEVETARTAKLFATGNANRTPDIGSLPAEPGPSTSPVSTDPTPLTGSDGRPRFLERTTGTGVSEQRVSQPRSPNILQAGAIIPIALLTGIRSDLPGQVTAQVTANIHDSPTGRVLLIPQGTRVIGDYDSDVAFGQRRVLLAWNRLIFPDGRSILLDRQPGTDAQGFAGLEDRVDYHWGQMARAAGLSTVLGIGAELGSSSDDNAIVRALRRGAADSISDTGRRIVDRQLNAAPTLTVRTGLAARILVTRDLVLEPYGAVP